MSNLSIGIVGLPNVGKSTLFNALLKRQIALAANYPFATIEPNIGIVEVPDARLEKLAEVVRNDFGRTLGSREVPEKIIYSTIQFVDIAGLVAGAHKGEGLGNKFLSHIRDVDAIIEVVRDFSDENVIRAGATSPESDIEVIKTELILADLQTIEKVSLKIRPNMSQEDEFRVHTLNKIKEKLDAGITINTLSLTHEELVVLKNYNFLTQKPVLIVLNIDESKIAEASKNNKNSEKICISAKIESELSSLSIEDQQTFMEDLGLEESGLNKVIRMGFSLLGLQSFLTAGPKEVRSWTIHKGFTAPQAAGVIHTDFERGFICAEVVKYADLVSAGSFKTAKDHGLLRVEGKNYVMQDGDVVEFRFNV